jgi:DNA-binding GntR family transcriptional regulator
VRRLKETDIANLTEQAISLSETAYQRLRGDIIACRFAPGQVLTEKQLEVITGFSTSPLRAALARLNHEGLINTLPRKGYQVSPLTPKSIDDLFVIWEIVGPELIRLGITNASEAEIADAKYAFEELDRHAREQGDAESALRDIEVVNSTFTFLAGATGNAYLVELYQRLAGDMGRIRALLLTSDSTVVGADPTEHWVRSILNERDADVAAMKARFHLEDTHRRVLDAVVRWPSVMTSEVVFPLTQS